MTRSSRKRYAPLFAFAVLLISLVAALPAQANVTLPGLNERLGFSSFRDFPNDAPYAEDNSTKGSDHPCGQLNNPDTSGECGEELYTIFPDGTQETRITTNTKEDTKFSWFPQIGGIFSYESRDGCDHYDLSKQGCNEDIFSATNPGPTRLTNWAGLDTTPTQSPDGSQIAFESDRVNQEQKGSPESQGPPLTNVFQERAIYTMSSSGEGAGAATLLTPLPSESLEFFDFAVQADLTPAWSPDGTRIAFTRVVFGMRSDVLDSAALRDEAEKYVGRFVTGELELSDVPGLLGENGPPTFTAFGISIQTYIAPAGGGEPELLGDEATSFCLFGQAVIINGEPNECNFDRHPAWTPDGSRILVDRLPGVAFLDLVEPRREGGTGIGLFPTDRDIVSINVNDHTDVINLSNATENEEECSAFFEQDGLRAPCDEDAKPAPSPDGTRVAFHSDRACAVQDEKRNDPFLQLQNRPSQCFDIWTMNTDGTDPQRVTTNEHADWNADWRRTEPPPPVVTAAPPAAPKAPARPTARIAGLRRACTASRRMRVRIRATAEAGVRSVRVSLDGRRIKTSRKSRFTVFVNANRLKPGRHRISVTVIDNAGQRRTTTRRFSRCAQARRRAAPRFTG